MSKLIMRLIINAIALWVAAYLVRGIQLSDDVVSVAIVALVFGVINAILKPIVKLLSLPFLIVTLGLFTLVINAFLLNLTSSLTNGLSVEGFGAAVWGGIIISIVSMILSVFVADDDDRKDRRKQRH